MFISLVAEPAPRICCYPVESQDFYPGYIFLLLGEYHPPFARYHILGDIEAEQPKSPKVPAFVTLCSLSMAWAQSSMTFRLCRCAISMMASISQHRPVSGRAKSHAFSG